MKKLIICDTYFQLMIVVQMRLTIFRNDNVDLYISDHSNNSFSIYENIMKLDLFSHVQYMNTKDNTYSRSGIEKVRDSIQLNFGTPKYLYIDKYNEIIFYGYNTIVYKIRKNICNVLVCIKKCKRQK